MKKVDGMDDGAAEAVVTGAHQQRVEAIWRALDKYCHSADYAGWDPFDGLNSRLFRLTPLAKVAALRLIWLQVLKRSPLNLRALLLVPKVQNAFGVALFARSYGMRGESERAAVLAERLLTLRCDPAVWGAGAWGYPFDWQARAFHVPSGVPNIVCTAYAVRAIADHRRGDAPSGEEIAVAASEFAERHLLRRASNGRLFIGYVPGSDAMVHNANLWGAYVLLKGWQAGTERFRAMAEEAIDYTLKAQREDGSWWYGERHHHAFVDGFHTGYNIEALDLCRRMLGASGYDGAVARALEFYREALFDHDGAPRYYAHTRWPIDCENAAQAVLTLLDVDPTPAQGALATRVLAWTLDHMWLPERGHFIYQRHRRYANRIPYMRWTQAWMHLALARWLAEHERGWRSALSGEGAEPGRRVTERAGELR